MIIIMIIRRNKNEINRKKNNENDHRNKKNIMRKNNRMEFNMINNCCFVFLRFNPPDLYEENSEIRYFCLF